MRSALQLFHRNHFAMDLRNDPISHGNNALFGQLDLLTNRTICELCVPFFHVV